MSLCADGALGHWWNTTGLAGPLCADSCRALLSGAEGSGGAGLPGLDQGRLTGQLGNNKQANKPQARKQTKSQDVNSL